jgi:hypothetical protein
MYFARCRQPGGASIGLAEFGLTALVRGRADRRKNHDPGRTTE